MKRSNSRGAVGALHPVLFFIFIYGISLFLAFFICNAIYRSMQLPDAQVHINAPLPPASVYELPSATITASMR